MPRRNLRSPYREEPPEQEGPSLLALLIIVNIGVFLLQTLFTVPNAKSIPAGHISLVKLQAGEFWVVFTHLFVHHDLLHLAGNMLLLFLFGRRVIADIGPKHFGYLFFLGGLAGTALQLFAGRDRDAAIIGCSGAVAAVMAAFAVIDPHYSITRSVRRWIPFRLSVRYVIIGFGIVSLGLDLAFRFLPKDRNLPGQDQAHLCHLGGLIFGWMYLARLSVRDERHHAMRRRQVPRFQIDSLDEESPFVPVSRPRRIRREDEFENEFSVPVAPEPVSDQEFLQEQVNPILEKLHVGGMTSLTADEQRILKEAAERLGKEKR